MPETTPPESYSLVGPIGPQLTFTSGPDVNGNALMVLVDRNAPTDPRDRAICRELLLHALALLDEAELNSRFGIPQPEEAQS